MRNIFLLFLFICITGSGWAQLLYPEVMEPRTPLNGPVVNKLTGLSFPPFLYKVRHTKSQEGTLSGTTGQ